jgi:hypothetical protein
LCVTYECDVLRRLGLDEWDVHRQVRMLESQMVGPTGRQVVTKLTMRPPSAHRPGGQ